MTHQNRTSFKYVSLYRISANSFRGNYSFLNLALFTVTFDLYFINLNSCRRNYSREETIQGRKLFAEIRHFKKPVEINRGKVTLFQFLINQKTFKQLNSELIYAVIVSPKMPGAEILQIFGWHFRRNDDLTTFSI